MRSSPIAAAKSMRKLLVAAVAPEDLGFRPEPVESPVLHDGEQPEPALPVGGDAVVGCKLGGERDLAEPRSVDVGEPVGEGHRVEPGRVRGRPWPIRIGHHLRGPADLALDFLEFVEQPLSPRLCEKPAVDHHGQAVIVVGDFQKFKAETFGIGGPGRMIGADQLAAALDVPSRDEIVEGENATAHAPARLEHGHVIARGAELEGRREPGEARADDDDRLARRSGEAAAAAQEQRRTGGRRSLEECAPRRPVDPRTEPRPEPPGQRQRHDAHHQVVAHHGRR